MMRWTSPSLAASATEEKKTHQYFCYGMSTSMSNLRHPSFRISIHGIPTANAIFFRSLARVVYRSVAFQYLIKYDKINRRTMAYRRHFFVVRQTAVQCCLMVVPVPPGSVSPSDVAIVCVRRRTYERDIKIHFLQSCDATHTQHPGSRATSILEGAGRREARRAQGIWAYMKMIMQSQQLETLLTLITLPERSLSFLRSSRLSLAHELQTIALVFDGSTQLKRRA